MTYSRNRQIAVKYLYSNPVPPTEMLSRRVAIASCLALSGSWPRKSGLSRPGRE